MANTHTVQTDSKGSYVVVKKGDTLSHIAVEFKSSYSIKNYQQLFTINKQAGTMSNANKLSIGQKVYLKLGASSSTTKTNTNTNKPVITTFGLDAADDNERTLVATWTWHKSSDTASYKVLWTYENGTTDKNGSVIWFEGTNSSITVDKLTESMSRQSTYSIPSGANRVRFKVKPIAKTKKKGSKDVEKWTADWSDTQTYSVKNPPDKPGTPSLDTSKLSQLKLTVSLDNIEIDEVTHIQFQLVKDNDEKSFVQETSTINAGYASCTFTVVSGASYKARCRSYDGKLYSDWSSYCSPVETRPATPGDISTIYAASESSVYLKWGTSKTATEYEIQYTTDKNTFDTSDQAQSKTVSSTVGDPPTEWTVDGLESGKEYFFRVRAKRNSELTPWTAIKSVAVGRAPAAPTTWSSTTSAVMGEPMNLYWVHNSQDGSSWKEAKLVLKYYNAAGSLINPGDEPIVIANTYIDDSYTDEDESNKTGVYSLAITNTNIQKIEWQVCTRGLVNTPKISFGEYSTPRTITVYEQPGFEEFSLLATDPEDDRVEVSAINSFPVYIYGLPKPATQVPIGYHLSITSNSTYETTDNFGNDKIVSAGDEVYSKYFDVYGQELVVMLSANNIDLENEVRYTATCVVSMNSGLTGTASFEFGVDWEEPDYVPNAEIGVDAAALTASIRPYCEDRYMTYRQVTKVNRTTYRLTDVELDEIAGEPVNNAVIIDGDIEYQVYQGTTAGNPDEGVEPEDVYFCEVESATPVTNVWLDVYRREFDGSFTELATDLDGEFTTTITDPHPALDFARYRVVSRHKDTGAVAYFDLPGYYIGCPEIIIQWDEAWTPFDATEDAELEQPAWTGSILRLPYNIDVSDNVKLEVELVEYAGRSHPVSYYGTQLGQSATWSTVIDKSDEETIYALRRLARWPGDVYVREPSGTGYWANITVSFSQKHLDQTIPVSFAITRVEGGA